VAAIPGNAAQLAGVPMDGIRDRDRGYDHARGGAVIGGEQNGPAAATIGAILGGVLGASF